MHGHTNFKFPNFLLLILPSHPYQVYHIVSSQRSPDKNFVCIWNFSHGHFMSYKSTCLFSHLCTRWTWNRIKVHIMQFSLSLVPAAPSSPNTSILFRTPLSKTIYKFPLDTQNFRHTYKLVISHFDIHMSVHYKHNSKLQPTRCNVSWFIYFYRHSTCLR